jgi:hypothetical protein
MPRWCATFSASTGLAFPVKTIMLSSDMPFRLSGTACT